MQYDLNLELISKNVRKGMSVLVQLPAGLRNHFLKIARLIRERGAEPFIWAGSCYGACDLPDYECDLLLHFGHEEFIAERSEEFIA
jgi:diphthamide biosynthesis enzyme Dph1/Dph2-like protein